MEAQVCQGTAALAAGPIRLGGDYTSGDGWKGYGLEMGVGAKDGVYAEANVSRSEFSDIDGSGKGVGLGAGYAINVNPAHTVQFCPLVSAAFQSGPDIDYGNSTIETSIRAFGFGGTLGGAVPVTSTLDLVPFAGALFVTERLSATLDGTSDSQSANSGLLDVGAGFVINKTLTLLPSVSVPFGIDGGKSSFELAISLNFGSAKH
jgi:hypothetical protein